MTETRDVRICRSYCFAMLLAEESERALPSFNDRARRDTDPTAHLQAPLG